MTRPTTARSDDPWVTEVVARTEGALRPLADPARAVPMAAYMKHVAPFLGVPAGDRRRAVQDAWRDLAPPSSDELGAAARALMALRERELHYCAYDLIARFLARADARFLADHVEALLTTTPWWDTVDGLGSAAVSPLCRRGDDHARPLVLAWSRSDSIWLVRAAIQHQRGWKGATDVAFVLDLCRDHAGSREFFVLKAIGWALRDLAAIDPEAVAAFVRQRPGLGAVAVREARTGLQRAGVRP